MTFHAKTLSMGVQLNIGSKTEVSEKISPEEDKFNLIRQIGYEY